MTSTIRSFDHVAIAVRSIEAALPLFKDAFGGWLIGGGDNSKLEMRAVQIGIEPGVKFELLMPLDEDSWLHGYLDKHGEGFHHVTFYTDDVLATETTMRGGGFETVDTDLSYPSWEETFSRPRSTFGCLLQFARPAVPWPKTGIPGISMDDVMNGRIVLRENDLWWRDTGEVIWPPGGPGWRTFDDLG